MNGNGMMLAILLGMGLGGASFGAAATKQQTFDLPGSGRAVTLTAKLGRLQAPWTLTLGNAGEKQPLAVLTLNAVDPLEGGMDVRLTATGQTAFSVRYFVKPDLKFYVDESLRNRFIFSLADRAAFDERRQVADKYHLFQSVLDHAFTVRLEPAGNGLAVWLDGRFLGTVKPGPQTAGQVAFPADLDPPVVADVPALSRGRFLPVDLRAYSRPGSLAFDAQPSNLPPAEVSLVKEVPLLVDARNGNVDAGLSRWLEEKIDPADFCDADTTRSAFDGNPESIIFRLPKENFMAAHVLCVVEPDRAKTPVLTLRLTRFGNHYGDSGGRTDQAIGDTTVYLPTNPAAADLPPGVVRIGEADVNTLKKTRWSWTREKGKLPLYLVTVPLKTGNVADLLGDDAPEFGRKADHWDLEVTKEIRTAVQFFNLQSCRIKPLGLPSSVHVIGLTLERSPVDVTVSAREKGNVFYAAADPAFDLSLVNRQDEPQTVEVTCDITDYNGVKSVGKTTVKLPGRNDNGGKAEGRLALPTESLGWFDAVITAALPDGRVIWREPTTFALLPPDTRKAGDESPFGVWWFAKSHGGCGRLDWMGPLLLKMGVRHTCPGPFSEEELKPYKLSYSMAAWPLGKREELLKKNPHLRLGMIFHEKHISDTDAIPPELLGKPKPALTEAGKRDLDKYWKEAGDAVAWYRSNYPAIKLSLGNSPSGISIWFMRQGWPRKDVDCFAMEGVGAWMVPEGQPRRGSFQEVWWLSEMRKLYGYADVPVSSGYEYITRCTQPGALTEREQGEYHARDALQALAYGFTSINIGLADDCADSYYSTIYGGSGFMRRNPLLIPKPGYVMYATLTRLLDSAAYRRYLDTGSRSLYALEFQRGGEYVYPVWTVRGKRELAFRFKGSGATVTDSMGNTRKLEVKNGRLAVEASTAPVYVVTPSPLEVEAAGKARFDEGPSAAAAVVAGLEEPAGVDVSNGRDAFLETYTEDLVYMPGDFAVRGVEDKEKGRCLELELKPQSNAPAVAARYVSLNVKEPVALDREAGRIGMWVKGNSCWGRVFWEFEDAKGERFFSAATEGAGWDVSDWRGRSAINFDGWCFVSLAVPKRYPGGYHGPSDRDWSYSGGNLDGVVQHPITVKRIVVALRDQQVYVSDMVPSKSRTIRLKGLTVE